MTALGGEGPAILGRVLLAVRDAGRAQELARALRAAGFNEAFGCISPTTDDGARTVLTGEPRPIGAHLETSAIRGAEILVALVDEAWFPFAANVPGIDRRERLWALAPHPHGGGPGHFVAPDAPAAAVAETLRAGRDALRRKEPFLLWFVDDRIERFEPGRAWSAVVERARGRGVPVGPRNVVATVVNPSWQSSELVEVTRTVLELAGARDGVPGAGATPVPLVAVFDDSLLEDRLAIIGEVLAAATDALRPDAAVFVGTSRLVLIGQNERFGVYEVVLDDRGLPTEKDLDEIATALHSRAVMPTEKEVATARWGASDADDALARAIAARYALPWIHRTLAGIADAPPVIEAAFFRAVTERLLRERSAPTPDLTEALRERWLRWSPAFTAELLDDGPRATIRRWVLSGLETREDDPLVDPAVTAWLGVLGAADLPKVLEEALGDALRSLVEQVDADGGDGKAELLRADNPLSLAGFLEIVAVGPGNRGDVGRARQAARARVRSAVEGWTRVTDADREYLRVQREEFVAHAMKDERYSSAKLAREGFGDLLEDVLGPALAARVARAPRT